MKGYTDLDQSKKLIELGIDVNTADMCYYYDHNWSNEHIEIPKIWDNNYEQFIPESEEDDIPCWSLAALLDVLPSATLDSSSDHYYRLHCMTRYTEWYDNPIDAAFEMIIKLHELKML